MFGAIGAALNLATGLAKGIAGKVAHNKYAKELGEVNMEMPSSILEAESIKKSMANRGLAGYDTMLGDIDSGVSTTMNKAKEISSNPNSLMNALIQSSTEAERQKRGLGVQNAQTLDANKNSLAQFLSTVKSPAEQRINQFEIDKKIAQAKEKMQGTAELFGGIESGVGNALSGFGSGKMLDMKGDELAMKQKYWDSLMSGNDSSGFGVPKIGMTQGFNPGPLPRLNF